MADRHWNDDDLLDRLYGIGRDDDHVETCADCRQRWMELRESRTSLLRDPEVPADLIARQRQAIWDRIEERSRVWQRRLIPAIVAGTFAIAILIQMPKPSPAPSMARHSVSEQALFEDVFAQAGQAEPESLTPIRALFEVNQ